MQITIAEQIETNPFEPVAAIARLHGANCSPEQFHAAVNVTFHKFESEVYDDLHKDMWQSVPQQFALLAQDSLRGSADTAKWTMLDIGCGTGLASDSIMKSWFGPRISRIDLLDTSAAMLRRASQRATNWNVPVRSLEGIVETVDASEQYDLIVTCSVLHHVPDLVSFLKSVRRLQRRGGIFLHLQDPNGDFSNDPEFQRRVAQLSKNNLPEWAARLAPQRVLGRLLREVTGRQGQDYLSKTNRDLLNSGVITSPLTVAEKKKKKKKKKNKVGVFQITDIHVQDGAGISIENMKGWLPDYQLISQRSYGFYGRLWSTLPLTLRIQEERLIAAQALNGGHIGAAWRLKA